MNITLRLIILLIILFSGSINLFAQTTDAFQYYILHDQSASVVNIDKNRNLKMLMESLIELSEKPKGVKIGVSSNFNIYSFGQDKRINDNNTVEYRVEVQSKNIGKKIQGLSDREQNKKQRHTNIHTALEKVIASLSKSAAESSGIFIFTDGKLDEKDYEFENTDPRFNEMKDISNYYKYLRNLIEQIKQLTNKPVFLVQSSYEPKNPYYLEIKNIKPVVFPNEPLQLINDNTIFWLKNTAVFDPKDESSEITKSYKDFIARANDMIINSTPTINAEGNPIIDKSILIQELTTINDPLRIPKLQRDAILKELPELQHLLKLINDNSISTPDIYRLKSYLEKIKIPDLTSAINDAQKVALNNIKNTPNITIASLPSLTVFSNALTGASPTLTSSVSQSQGLKSFEQNVILGVTDYVIDRAKQEAVYAFMENVKEKYVDGNPHLKTLFPELIENLKDPGNYYDMKLLKETFRRDLNYLPENIKNNRGIFKRSNELLGLVSMMKLFKNVSEQQSLELAFRELGKDLASMDVDSSRTLDAFIFTSNVIGYLESNDLSSVYNDAKQLEELSALILTMSIDSKTLGRLDSVKIKNSTKLIGEIYQQYRLIKTQISELNLMGQPNSDFDGFRKMKSDAVLNILNRSADLLFSGFGILDKLKFKYDTTQFDYLTLKNNIKRCVDGYFLLKSYEYSQAVLLLAPVVMDAVYTSEVFKNNQTYLESKKITLTKFLEKKVELKRLLYVAGEVSEAKDAESIKKIMAKYALPVASYRIKHNSTPTLMVNAYLGLGLNCFMATQPKNEVAIRPVINAPVGLELSWKFKPKGQAYFSVFASVVDLGNIVNYRLWSSDSENKEDIIKFENIVSPGLFLIYAPFKKWPVALNAGYAFNPRRISLSINFDLPLFAISRGTN